MQAADEHLIVVLTDSNHKSTLRIQLDMRIQLDVLTLYDSILQHHSVLSMTLQQRL